MRLSEAVTKVHQKERRNTFRFYWKDHACIQNTEGDKTARERKGIRSTALKPRTEEQMVRSNQNPLAHQRQEK